MDRIKFYLYYLVSQFEGFPTIVRVTIFLIMVLAFLYLVSLFKIVFIARNLRKERVRKHKIKKKYEHKLESILFSEHNMTAEQVRANLNLDGDKLKDWEKTHITDLMMNLISNRNEVKYQ